MFVPVNINKAELEVDHSRFIALLFPFNNINDLDNKLNEVKKEYPKAKHYLYAYHVNQLERSNDDQEPGSIAKGFIKLINDHKLDKVLIVVVRYFGGTKLGASRLLRTYLKVVNDVMSNVNKQEIKLVYHYYLVTDYKTFNEIKKRGYLVANVQYDDKIKFEITSLVDISSLLKQYSIIELVKKEGYEPHE